MDSDRDAFVILTKEQLEIFMKSKEAREYFEYLTNVKMDWGKHVVDNT